MDTKILVDWLKNTKNNLEDMIPDVEAIIQEELNYIEEQFESNVQTKINSMTSSITQIYDAIFSPVLEEESGSGNVEICLPDAEDFPAALVDENVTDDDKGNEQSLMKSLPPATDDVKVEGADDDVSESDSETEDDDADADADDSSDDADDDSDESESDTMTDGDKGNEQKLMKSLFSATDDVKQDEEAEDNESESDSETEDDDTDDESESDTEETDFDLAFKYLMEKKEFNLYREFAFMPTKDYGFSLPEFPLHNNSRNQVYAEDVSEYDSETEDDDDDSDYYTEESCHEGFSEYNTDEGEFSDADDDDYEIVSKSDVAELPIQSDNSQDANQELNFVDESCAMFEEDDFVLVEKVLEGITGLA